MTQAICIDTIRGMEQNAVIINRLIIKPGVPGVAGFVSNQMHIVLSRPCIVEITMAEPSRCTSGCVCVMYIIVKSHSLLYGSLFAFAYYLLRTMFSGLE
jgi:hypothetical protein